MLKGRNGSESREASPGGKGNFESHDKQLNGEAQSADVQGKAESELRCVLPLTEALHPEIPIGTMSKAQFDLSTTEALLLETPCATETDSLADAQNTKEPLLKVFGCEARGLEVTLCDRKVRPALDAVPTSLLCERLTGEESVYSDLTLPDNDGPMYSESTEECNGFNASNLLCTAMGGRTLVRGKLLKSASEVQARSLCRCRPPRTDQSTCLLSKLQGLLGGVCCARTTTC